MSMWEERDPATEMGSKTMRIEESTPDQTGFGTAVATSMAMENPTTGFIMNSQSYPGGLTDEEDRAYSAGEFNPVEALKDTEWDHPVYLEKIAEAKSQREVDWMTGIFSRQLREEEILSNASTPTLIGASMIGGLLEPMYAPAFAVPVVNGSILAKAGLTAGVEAGLVTGSELILHEQQPKRTLNESLFNIGGTAFLAGLLGAATFKLGNTERVKLAEDLDVDVKGEGWMAGDYHMAAGSSASNINHNVTEEFMNELGIKVAKGELTQHQAAKLVRDEELKNTSLKYGKPLKILGGRSIMSIFGHASPQIRVATSSSVKARDAVENLVEDSLIRQKNEYGLTSEASAETLAKAREMSGTYEVIDITKQAFAAYRKNGGTMKEQEFLDAIGDAIIDGDVHKVPEVAQAAVTVRSKVISPLEKELADVQAAGSDKSGKLINVDKEGNITVAHGDKKSVHRVYDLDKIMHDSRRMTMEMVEHIRNNIPNELKDFVRGLDVGDFDDTIYDAVHRYIKSVQASPTGYHARHGVTLRVEGQKYNVDIPSAVIRDWLIKDPTASLGAYLKAKVPQLEIARKFDGDIHMTDALTEIDREYGAMLEAKMKPYVDAYGVEVEMKDYSPKDQKAIKKFTKELNDENTRVRLDLEAMRDMMLHKYAEPTDPASMWHRAGKRARELNYMTSLGAMMLASIPDIGSAIVRVGLGNMAAATRKLAQSPEIRAMSKSDLNAAGVALDATLHTRQNALGMLNESYSGQGKVDKLMKSGQVNFTKATGMPYWNSFLKSWAGTGVMHRIGKLVHKQNLSMRDKQYIASLRIPEDDWTKIVANWKRTGSDEQGLHSPNMHDEFGTSAWDVRSERLLSAAVLKEADSAIVTPGVGDIPLFARTGPGKLIFQFKTFMMTAHNKLFLPGIQKAGYDPNVAFGATMMVGLGVLSYTLKELAAGREISDDWETLVREGVDKSGVFALPMYANNITEKLTQGQVSLLPLPEGPPITQYQSRSVLGDLMGPSWGTANDARQSIAGIVDAISTGELSPSTVKATRRLTPYQNHFILRRSLFDTAQDAINEEL